MCEDFKNGIFNLNTRQFGTVAEILVKFINRHDKSTSIHFDAFEDKKKIEVKSSRVYKANKLEITEENLYELIVNNSNENRLLKSVNSQIENFDCNIQQIKIKEFDFLYYVLFFSDIIEMFKIESSKIKNDEKIFYSDKQHKGNIGEGQFHINNKTYTHHKDNYFECSFTYKKIKDLLLKQKTR